MSLLVSPRVLAIETATEACSAALLYGDEVISRLQIAPRDHGRLILGMIDDLLAEAGLGVAALDCLAFGRGPGAFTGVRIATGVVQGIAFAADLPVARVSTLMALAHGCWREQGSSRVLAAIDARINEIYYAAYHFTGAAWPQCVVEERVCLPEHAPVPDVAGWHAAGSGWEAYQGVMMPRFAGLVERSSVGQLPHAIDVALLGRLLAERGDIVVAEQALPVYLRDQVAAKSAAKQ